MLFYKSTYDSETKCIFIYILDHEIYSYEPDILPPHLEEVYIIPFTGLTISYHNSQQLFNRYLNINNLEYKRNIYSQPNIYINKKGSNYIIKINTNNLNLNNNVSESVYLFIYLFRNHH